MVPSEPEEQVSLLSKLLLVLIYHIPFSRIKNSFNFSLYVTNSSTLLCSSSDPSAYPFTSTHKQVVSTLSAFVFKSSSCKLNVGLNLIPSSKFFALYIHHIDLTAYNEYTYVSSPPALTTLTPSLNTTWLSSIPMPSRPLAMSSFDCEMLRGRIYARVWRSWKFLL